MNGLATLVLVLAACQPSHESTLTIVLREGLVSPYPLADTTDFKAIGVGMAMEGTPYRQFTREHFTVPLPDSGVAIPTMVVPESGFISMGVRFFRVVGYDTHSIGETPPLEWVLEPESDWTLRIWPADENADDGTAHFWYRLTLYYGTDHELMWSVSLHRRDADVCSVPCIVNSARSDASRLGCRDAAYPLGSTDGGARRAAGDRLPRLPYVPGQPSAPNDVYENADEPSDWDAGDIREHGCRT